MNENETLTMILQRLRDNVAQRRKDILQEYDDNPTDHEEIKEYRRGVMHGVMFTLDDIDEAIEAVLDPQSHRDYWGWVEADNIAKMGRSLLDSKFLFDVPDGMFGADETEATS